MNLVIKGIIIGLSFGISIILFSKGVQLIGLFLATFSVIWSIFEGIKLWKGEE